MNWDKVYSGGWFMNETKKNQHHFKHYYRTAVNTSGWWCRTFSVNHANIHSNGNFPFATNCKVKLRIIQTLQCYRCEIEWALFVWSLNSMYNF